VAQASPISVPTQASRKHHGQNPANLADDVGDGSRIQVVGGE